MNLKIVLPLVFATISASAMADGPYILGQVTHSNLSVDNANFDNALTAGGVTGLSSSNNGSGNQWRLQVGYKFNPYFAIEAGYMDLGTANYSASFAGGTANASEKAGGVNFVALGILPVTDTLSVFGKAGFLAAKVKTELSSSPLTIANISDSSNDIRPLLGVGATYGIQKNVDLRVDYDHVAGLGNSGQGGKMDANMLSVGIAYKF